MILDDTENELGDFINDILMINSRSNDIYKKNLINEIKDKNNENINIINIFNVGKCIKLPLIDYINRFITYLDCSISCYIYTLIYIDKIVVDNPYLYLTRYNIYKLFSISLLCAYKFIDDDIVDNKYYSKIAGIELKELNLLERLFLTKINYELYVADDIFNLYLQQFPKNIINVINNTPMHK